MKHLFITVLSFLVFSGTAFGQVSTVPALRIDTPNTAASDIVADVNGERITRSTLAAECLQLHGADELQELINKTLIRLECERQNITITAEEINAEVLRMAQTFDMSSEDWLKVLERERGISPEQYRNDIIWRILALGKLAGPHLSISNAELQTEYERNYGAAVQLRQIVLASKADADAVLAEVQQHPETFASIAKNRSVDPGSQPYGGMIRPIRRHSFHPHIEKILFEMKPGDISPVIEYPQGYFTIYLCEGHLRPVDIDIAAVTEQLKIRIRDAKLRQIADEVFMDLQKNAKVLVVFGNPALYNQYPGVAALLNGQIISQQELADLCVQKHGKEALNDMINRRLVEQACRRANIIISDRDIDTEIREMAEKHLSPMPNGEPNVDLWLRRAMEETGLSIPMYRKNVVVPVLALKRLTHPLIQVTNEEIMMAYEANYGRKVQCLAIFFRTQDQRRAMEVWQLANQQRTEENFGDLAVKYSFDFESRQGRGMIPPIARYCGHPELEAAAFSLKPEELSHIIQVEDSLVILYCISHIDPLPVKIEEVKDELHTHIFEKKQQIIISRYFERLLKEAVFANYLTGESQNPALEKAMQDETSLQR